MTRMSTMPIPSIPVTMSAKTPRLARSGRRGVTMRRWGRADLWPRAPRVAYSVPVGLPTDDSAGSASVGSATDGSAVAAASRSASL